MSLPSKLLTIAIMSANSAANWPSDSSTYAGSPYRWTVTLNITPQLHSSPSTRTPFTYDGMDVVVGDWVSNIIGGFAWVIQSITTQTSNHITCIVEDHLQYNTYNDSSTNGDGSPPAPVTGFLFSTDTSGQPILSAVTGNVLTSQWQTDLMARFAYASAPFNTAMFGVPTGNSIVVGATALTKQNGALEWVPTDLVSGAGPTGPTGPTGPAGSGGGSGLVAIASHDLLANITGSSAIPSAVTVTEYFDAALGNAQGSVLFRSASAWTVLAPGVSGQILQCSGASGNPLWVDYQTSLPLGYILPGKPNASAFFNLVIAVPLVIPANFAGTVVYDATPPTANAIFTLNKISAGVTTTLGTITITSASNTSAILSTQAQVSLSVGDVLQLFAPSSLDATLADIGITILTTKV